MKTVPYNLVLRKAANLSGRAYENGNGSTILNAEESAVLRTLIGSAIRHIWTAAPFPETLEVEQRYFAKPWESTTAFAAGDVCYWPADGEYYLALKANTGYEPSTLVDETYEVDSSNWIQLADSYSTDEWDASTAWDVGDVVRYPVNGRTYAKHTPSGAGVLPTNASYWGEVTAIERLVEFQQDWEDTVIGDVFGVWPEDPRRTEFQNSVPVTYTRDGILVVDEISSVWVEFFTMPPSFTADPATIPHRFSEYAAFAAAGMMLKRDGKLDAGNQTLGLASRIEADLIAVLNREESRVGRLSVV